MATEGEGLTPNSSPEGQLARDALAEIEQVLYRYCAGVDRKDWDLVASCYHPEAIDDHGDVSGPVADFLEWLEKRHERVAQSFHSVSNVRVVASKGNEATVIESLCTVRQVLTRRSGDTLSLSLGCRYVDLFRHHDGRWLIARRTVTYDWVEEVEPTRDLLRDSATLTPTERGSDTLKAFCRLLDEA